MSAHRTERLLNLVIALLSTRRWLSKEQIRAAVPQYAACASTEAFDRMFERDKEDLRELGVPLATGSDDAWFEDEPGYRVDRDAYALPEVVFTPQELAVLGLASRVWQQASLAGPATRALVKLRALGVEPDEDSLVGVEPRVRTAEPAFDALYGATRDRAPVTFTYRTASTGRVARRHVQPYGITSWHGHWYLVGHDVDRGAERVFRLSRVEGGVRRAGAAGSYAVPDGLDVRERVAALSKPPADREAVVRLREGAGQALRRRAVRTEADGGGWDRLVVGFGDAEELADAVAALGPDAVVLEPDDVRDAVVRRLRAVASGAVAGGSVAGGAA